MKKAKRAATGGSEQKLKKVLAILKKKEKSAEKAFTAAKNKTKQWLVKLAKLNSNSKKGVSAKGKGKAKGRKVTRAAKPRARRAAKPAMSAW